MEPPLAHPAAVPLPVAAATAPLPEMAAAAREPRPPRSRRVEPEPRPEARVKPWMGWLLLATMVVGLIAGGLIAREQLLEALPSTAKLYALLGFGEEAAGEGLALENVTSVRRRVDGDRMLIIKGEVANVGDGPRPVPLLRASLTDAQGQELLFWVFETGESQLEPGARTAFETQYTNPPEGGANLSIGFEARPH